MSRQRLFGTDGMRGTVNQWPMTVDAALRLGLAAGIRRGRADFSTSNTALRFARVILEKYNGQRGGRKLPYRFRG